MLGSEAEEMLQGRTPSRCCPGVPCCPGRTHEALTDAGPLVNERDIGDNELGLITGRDNPAIWLEEGVCLPCDFWTN